MSLITHIAAAIATAKALQRECPACGKKQFIAHDKLRQAVPCKHCKTPIPPKKERQ